MLERASIPVRSRATGDVGRCLLDPNEPPWVEHEERCARTHRYEPNPHKRYVPEIEAALATLKAIVLAYKRDNSDSQTDYFSCNFYDHVDVDHALEHAARSALAK